MAVYCDLEMQTETALDQLKLFSLVAPKPHVQKSN